MANNNSPAGQARVKTSYSNTVILQTENNTLIEAKLHKKILRPVCGDMVSYSRNTFNEYLVDDVLPRKNELKRLAKDSKLKIFAANVTQMLIVVAIEPVYSRYLIDRYIAYAEVNSIHPIIVFNKCDLFNDSNKRRHEDIIQEYMSLGYKIIYATNVDTLQPELTTELTNNTSILVGQSGVGKSSLINSIIPSLLINTGDLSKKTGEGIHTTTNTESYDLPHGGNIIDSPGVREFTPYFDDANQIQHGFREFKPYIDQCKFRNCLHHHEEGCKVKEAVQSEEINRLRYNSYIDILNIYSC